MVIEIEVKDVKVYYKSTKAIDGVSLHIKKGEVLCVIGPNGAGKSTLLRVINGILKPKIGTVYVDKRSIYEIPHKSAAKIFGYVPQKLHSFGMISVYDFVMTGRKPHIGLVPTKADDERVFKALKLVNMENFAERTLEELSGGELQRVLIARALAGEPEVLILDEPTNNLDLKHQTELLNLVKVLRNEGLIVIMSLHDLTQAYRISDKVLLMNKGKVVAFGEPSKVLRADILSRVYGVPIAILKEYKIVTTL
ncbi:MAG: ABC transporter ATP-binding protein [Fervidicoccus fontis]